MPSADPLQTTVSFPLIVDSDLSLTAQLLLRRECGAQICSIQMDPLPDTHQTCLRVTLTAAAYGLVLHAIILGLPAAQFGAVRAVDVDVVPYAQAA